MKIDEHQEKSNFNTKSLTSIPFGGPIGQGSRGNRHSNTAVRLVKQDPSASTTMRPWGQGLDTMKCNPS